MLRKTLAALDDFQIEGVETSLATVKAMLRREARPRSRFARPPIPFMHQIHRPGTSASETAMRPNPIRHPDFEGNAVFTRCPGPPWDG